MLSPNLNIAPNSDTDKCRCRGDIELGFDVAAKYYCITKSHTVIQDGVHIHADKKMILTIEQAEKLRDDLISFFGAHKKY